MKLASLLRGQLGLDRAQVDRTAIGKFLKHSTNGTIHASGKCNTVGGHKPTVICKVVV